MTNSFAQQIEILEGLKAKLRDVQNYLETISGNYDAKVSSLAGEGFLRGVPYTALEDNLADTKAKFLSSLTTSNTATLLLLTNGLPNLNAWRNFDQFNF